ncbi:MAG: response regulator, partial [Nitrospirae bacterium]|nr:response regulator [Nitrospirota bacterium]
MNILIAEDEDVSRKHLIYALEDEGYSTHGVTNGVSALEEIEKRQYQVVITDIKMPGMGGLELFSIIRDKYPEISVIIITGYGTVAAAVAAIKDGAEDYITKPFNIDDMLVKLSKIKEKHAMRREIEALRVSAGLSGKVDLLRNYWSACSGMSGRFAPAQAKKPKQAITACMRKLITILN